MKVLLIHNPEAGDDANAKGHGILELIREAGYDAEYQSSKEKDWDKALETGIDLVAVAGGDGTVGKVAKRLLGRKIPIAILPQGTANNISKTLGLTELAVERWIDAWPAAKRMKFDAVVASGPWGLAPLLEGLGMGLFASTMSRLDARDNIDLVHVDDAGEKLEAVIEMLMERLKVSHPRGYKIWLDGRDLSGEYVLVEAMNIRYVGPNLELAPEADPTDGRFNLVLVSTDDSDALRAYLSNRLRGVSSPPSLPIYKGSDLQFEWEGFAIHIDDEVWPGTSTALPLEPATIDVRIDHHALEFLTPNEEKP